MTVVATDGYDIACDSAVTEATHKDPSTNFIKAVQLSAVKAKRAGIPGRGGAVVGCAGDASVCYAYLAWVQDMRRRKPERDILQGSEFEALAVREDGSVWYVDEHLVWFPVGTPHAIGSGAPFALGRMYNNPSRPRQAVEAACHYDNGCGGDILEFNVRPRRD